MKMILKLMIGVGFFLLVGTAGAGDVDFISMKQILNQSIISVAMIILSAFSLKIIEEKEEKRRRERRMRRAQLYHF